MKKKFLIISSILFVLLVLLGLILFLNPFCIFEKKDCECSGWSHFKQANEIIQKVERYIKKNGVLPNSLEDIGEKTTMEGPFYNKIDSKEYEVWFGTYLGESCVYRSKTKKWTPY
jgi:hypothetical protein